MISNRNARLLTVLGLLPAGASCLAVAGGTAVLGGWTLDNRWLMSVVPGGVPMNPATAVAFILTGVALALRRVEVTSRRFCSIATGCAAAVAAIGLVRLGTYALGVDAGVDQLLFRERLAAVPFGPSRMAPDTALNFLLCGLALLFLDTETRRGHRPAQYLALVVAGVGFLVITSYAYRAGPLRLGAYTPMALNTSSLFVILALGVLAVRHRHGLMAVLTNEGVGGTLLRRLLPAVVGAPWVLAWLLLWGERAGRYGHEGHLVVTVVAMIAMIAGLGVLTWRTAWMAERVNTERLRAEDAHRRTQAQLQAILDNAPAVIYAKDLGGRLLFVNRRFAEVFHLSRAEAAGKTSHDLFPAELADTHWANDRRVLETRTPIEAEEHALHDDGAHTYISVKFPLLDERGVPYALCGISTDITDRKREEDQLRESLRAREEAEARFRDIVEYAGNGIMIMNAGGRITLVNAEMCRLTGYQRDELVGQSVEVLVPKALRANHRKLRETFLVDAQRHLMRSGRALACRRKDGTEFPTDISLGPLPTPDGGVVVATIADLTERQQAEDTLRAAKEAAEAANRELEAFSYSVSHDLRAPLRAIDGYARILVEDHAARFDAEGERVLGTICAQARHMGRLIDDLLAFARLGRQALTAAPVDMAALARAVGAEVEQQDTGRAVTLTVAALPPARGDERLLRQVFANLLGNAWKFTRGTPDAHIEVGARGEDGAVTYFVRDNGVGFDMAHAEKLFGVFQRLHSAEEFEGTGVGLALVQRIVQRHGGRVWAEATVNGGATVYFALPAAAGEERHDGCGDSAG